MWDLIVLIPDHCLSFYFSIRIRTVHFVADSKISFEGFMRFYLRHLIVRSDVVSRTLAPLLLMLSVVCTPYKSSCASL